MDGQNNTTEYVQYLEEIRRRIFTLAILFILSFVGGFLGASKIISLLVKAFKLDNVTIAATSPFQYVELATSIGIFTALILIAPLGIYHFYAFLKPALTKTERRLFFRFLPLAFILFAVGFLYGVVTIYVAFKMLALLNNSIGVSNIWDINKFFSQIVVTSALLGLIFQFPLILTYLVKINLVDVKFLIGKRRHAIVAIFIFVALLPPTDGISLLMTALPLVAIYELTIFVNRTSFRAA